MTVRPAQTNGVNVRWSWGLRLDREAWDNCDIIVIKNISRPPTDCTAVSLIFGTGNSHETTVKQRSDRDRAYCRAMCWWAGKVEFTYGIIPIYFSESVLGLIPLVSSSHQWDWSFRCLKIICGTDPWGVLKSPTRCRHSFINHNEGTSSRALWKWQHKYCQCPRACQTLIAIVPLSL